MQYKVSVCVSKMKEGLNFMIDKDENDKLAVLVSVLRWLISMTNVFIFVLPKHLQHCCTLYI